jgi:hypothetical protein
MNCELMPTVPRGFVRSPSEAMGFEEGVDRRRTPEWLVRR